jgi:hypothetical protein
MSNGKPLLDAENVFEKTRRKYYTEKGFPVFM